MAADTTGHKPTDHIRTTMLLENAIEISFDFLKEDGFFLGKCFKGGTEASVLNTLNNSFKTYLRGSRRIDFALTTPHLASQVKHMVYVLSYYQSLVRQWLITQ